MVHCVRERVVLGGEMTALGESAGLEASRACVIPPDRSVGFCRDRIGLALYRQGRDER